MSVLHNATRELEKILDSPEPNLPLARRYVAKLREVLICQFCGEDVNLHDADATTHYKATVHTSCLVAARQPQKERKA